jgi:hypothetical protein
MTTCVGGPSRLMVEWGARNEAGTIYEWRQNAPGGGATRSARCLWGNHVKRLPPRAIDHQYAHEIVTA